MAKDVKRRSKSVPFDGAGEYKLDPDTLELLERLRRATKWDHGTLADHLGSPVADPDSGVDAESTDDWKALLGVVSEAAGMVDTVWDKRHVVIEFSSLVRVAGECGRVRDAARLLASTVRESGEGGLSPLGYIALGEIDAASEIVATQFGYRSLSQTSPYRGEPIVHLSEPRIALYLDGKRALLGKNVFERMRSHIASCDACTREVAFCASDRDARRSEATADPGTHD